MILLFQVLRSVDYWNAGQNEREFSIYNAYCDAITKAKHYVYLENQFFITSSKTYNKIVNNTIGKCIVDRIIKAHRKKEVFRVYVVLPLLPAFEGQIGTTSGVAMQFIVYWCYDSIIRGKNSLINCLLENGVTDWQKYISFCSLRKYERLEDKIVTELIYVHSKLLIVDDNLVIAGSANLNDRSMLGERDSEVDLIIEDKVFEEGIMNNKVYQGFGEFAGNMRKYLFMEHLGLTDSDNADICDPTSDHFFFNVWESTATKNTDVYEEVFACYPSDKITTFDEIKSSRATTCIADSEKLQDIKGHLVKFPLNFLKDTDMKPKPGTKEYLLPTEVWT